jgi:hypothetical protein
MGEGLGVRAAEAAVLRPEDLAAVAAVHQQVDCEVESILTAARDEHRSSDHMGIEVGIANNRMLRLLAPALTI